jgi:ABC-2 type transport system ATP-binding protein
VTIAELDNVSKSFGSTRALTRVSFRIGEGEVVAVLGPNGAGKSTAIGVLLGLRHPDAGVARLFGGDPTRPRSRRLLGVTPQETAFPDTLRVREIVELVRAHYESPLAVEALVEGFELEKLEARQTGGLSGGERRRLGVALAFVGNPQLAVLDEPTTGLDIEARKAVWAAVRAQRAYGGSVLLTTHHLAEAEALADRVVLIEGGVVVADGTVAGVKADAGMTLVRFRAAPGLDVSGAERDGAYLRILTPDAGETLDRLVRARVPLDELEVRAVTLEEALEARGGRR